MALGDYGALIRSGQAAVPDYAADEARKQLLSLQQGQLRQQMAVAQRQIDAEDAFETDLATVLTNPTAEGYSRIIARHPKFAQQAKASWDILDKGRQSADLQSMSEVYAAAANGKHDLAAALLERRIDADKAAGQPADPADQAMLDALKSGDPVQQKAALGMIGVTLSAITGPEKFEATLGQLTKGKERKLRETGGVVWDENTGAVIGRIPGSEVKIIPGVGIEQVNIEGVPLLGTGGPVAAAPPAAAPPPARPDPAPTAPIDLDAASAIGGQFGQVTSTRRTPERNKAVSGVANSHHLSGRAIDIARKSGVSHAQIEKAYRDAGYQIIESLDEGDHSHFAFGGATGGLPQVRARQQWEKLPKGARYVAPDGSVRVKG